MYLRTKEVRGNKYYYLVKGVREGEKVRQKVVKYLGREIPSLRKLRGKKSKKVEEMEDEELTDWCWCHYYKCKRKHKLWSNIGCEHRRKGYAVRIPKECPPHIWKEIGEEKIKITEENWKRLTREDSKKTVIGCTQTVYFLECVVCGEKNAGIDYTRLTF